jgi:ribosomal protein S18 acetylase RimI-like enzyme
MTPEIRPAHELPADRVHEAFLQAFSDYLIGPFELPLARWPQFLGRQCVDLALSRVAVVDGAVRAFAFVSPRGDAPRWRLATMGALPAARGSGAAPALLDDLIERARAAGAQALELEAFAQNERAVRLYRSRGFGVVQELHAYEAPPGPDPVPAVGPPSQAVDLVSAFNWLDAAARRIGDVPLQVTAASLSALSDGLRAWRADRAQLVAGFDAEGAVVVHSLVDEDREQRGAETLARDLRRRFPGRRVVVPPLQRPDLGGHALGRAGFDLRPLHQVMMVRGLGSRL